MGAQSDAIVAEMLKGLSDVATEIVLEITANLVEATPVDTGWARANWVPSIGEPPPTDPVGAPGQPSTSEQAAGQLAMLDYTPDKGPAFISNNVPYIQVLNDGSSTQAPSGFVERAIEQGLQTIQQRHDGKKTEL